MFICYSIELFRFLVGEGLIPAYQRRDFKKPSIKVWGFKDTEELRELISEYSSKRKYKEGNV